MRTAATNKKIREIIQAVRSGKIMHRPEFQRRLVWSRDDKNLFIDTILRQYPFPEIYLADGEVDLETGEGTQLLVDGLQRVSTIIQYFDGDSELKLISVPPYSDLSDDEKKAFLQYDVAVRDLGTISRDEVIDAFKRLNATKYSLLDIEINNAIYAGALKRFAEQTADDIFFERHKVFNALDLKRMGDLRFVLTIIISFMSGYFNRDDEFQPYLERYNDECPMEQELHERFQTVVAFIEECGFSSESRVWRKADLLTLLVELDQAFFHDNLPLQPSDVLARLEEFYAAVDASGLDGGAVVGIYYKAALQASNDRINRVRRGLIVEGLLRKLTNDEIIATLRAESFL
jgi:hypothetical protein